MRISSAVNRFHLFVSNSTGIFLLVTVTSRIWGSRPRAVRLARSANVIDDGGYGPQSPKVEVRLNTFPFTSIMSWQNSGEGKTSYNPGPTPQYANPTGPLVQGNDSYALGDGSTGAHARGFEAEGYEGSRRFEPKKKIRDPIFLILFIAQVRHVPL